MDTVYFCKACILCGFYFVLYFLVPLLNLALQEKLAVSSYEVCAGADCDMKRHWLEKCVRRDGLPVLL